jgi:hypothetical protein
MKVINMSPIKRQISNLVDFYDKPSSGTLKVERLEKKLI